MIDGLFIKQKISLLEVVSGCETSNRYDFYQKKEGELKKKNKRKLWSAKEKSNCYSRNYLSNECRGMEIKIKNETNMDDDVSCIKIHKPCTCTYWCCNRPVIHVDYVEEQNQEKYLGRIVDNFDFCNFSFSVYDAND